jgi:hypothetical protein
MSEATIRELFRSLERTIHERLQCIEDVLLKGGNCDGMEGCYMAGRNRGVGCSSDKDTLNPEIEMIQNLSQRLIQQTELIFTLEKKVDELQKEIRGEQSLLPTHPLEGIELIPKKEVVLPMSQLSIEDRLLLNKRARKALEAQEMGEKEFEDHPEIEEEVVVGNEGEEDVHLIVTKKEDAEKLELKEEIETKGAEEEVEVEVEEEAEEEAEEVEEEVAEEVEEEVEEEEEAVELEEFEYKGATYYRDNDNNVFMTDEDGELVDEPIGVWSEVKKRIIVKKPVAA